MLITREKQDIPEIIFELSENLYLPKTVFRPEELE
jgi:hypothetical protein